MAKLDRYTGAWEYKQAAHLLRRAMAGVTDQEIRTAVDEGLTRTIERLLTTIPSPSTDLIDYFYGKDPNTQPPLLDAPEYWPWFWNAHGRQRRLVQWWLRSIATSPVSILEKMLLFWHGHFTLAVGKVEFAELALTYHLLLRRNALGNFKQLAKDVTKDLAMLIYLDGLTNTQQEINENYAREFLELFTVGRADRYGKPNYTQSDVRAAARSFTGWGRKASVLGPEYSSLESEWVDWQWDHMDKLFLGRSGAWKTDDIVDIVFEERKEQIAYFMCSKIYRWLVCNEPDSTVIEEMSTTFIQNNWEIAPVIAQLLSSTHFYEDENIGCIEKNPIELLVGMIRCMRLNNVPDFSFTDNTKLPHLELWHRLGFLGYLLLSPPNVNGWEWGRNWVNSSALVQRLRFVTDVAKGNMVGIKDYWLTDIYNFDPVELAKQFPNPDSITDLCNDMIQFFLCVPPSENERKHMYNTLLDVGTPGEWRLDDPNQRCGDRIRKFLSVLFTLPKYQLT